MHTVQFGIALDAHDALPDMVGILLRQFGCWVVRTRAR
jgi:hypothetical protein